MRIVSTLLLALAMMATACSSSPSSTSVITQEGGSAPESPSSPDEPDSASASTSPSTPDDDRSASDDNESSLSGDAPERRSPIADFLGQDFTDFEFDEAAEIERQREVERRVAACMRDQGFEYIPRDMSEMISFSRQIEEEFDPGSDAWINKYGFGITTQRFPQSQVGDLVGFPDEQFADAQPEPIEDPNREYLESLSEGEREAYQMALYGLPPEVGPEGSVGPPEDFMPTGCQFTAYEESQDGNIAEFYQAFGDEMQTLYERMESDSRVIAFNADVNACVAKDGLTWTGFEDVYEQFEPRMNELQPRGFMGGGDPFEEAGLDPDEMSERELQEFFDELNRLDPSQLALLAELQAEEIALAKAVMACNGGPDDYDRVLGEVRIEYEQRFLDENAEELEQYRAD